VVSAACRDQPIVSKIDTITGGQFLSREKKFMEPTPSALSYMWAVWLACLSVRLSCRIHFHFFFFCLFLACSARASLPDVWGVYLTDERTRESKFERNRSEKFVSAYCSCRVDIKRLTTRRPCHHQTASLGTPSQVHNQVLC